MHLNELLKAPGQSEENGFRQLLRMWQERWTNTTSSQNRTCKVGCLACRVSSTRQCHFCREVNAKIWPSPKKHFGVIGFGQKRSLLEHRWLKRLLNSWQMNQLGS
ncbi:hypothetical protein BLNAU_18766 [Blattamonas nauphoetae]|uniref:Uncharacterized protein n=1 Tax=Blattamonas nauphoetae TaxID=2049346 RepID=A0ABQ9X6R5_9EUKA|nr:hypothetical protein BLNAU_18766 [Blattamonas nauphoetae]